MIWLVPSFLYICIVFFIDYLIRKKRWSENTSTEKQSLIINALASFPYVFCSFLGLFLGITGVEYDSNFLNILYDIILIAGNCIGIVSLIATVASLVFRKIGKSDLSKKVHYIALIYIFIVVILYIIFN